MNKVNSYLKSARLRGLWFVCASAVALASCASSGPQVTYVKKTRSASKEYFSEQDYGVKASPRVVNVASAVTSLGHAKRLPRGGGRDQVGKPYKVRGKWYYPKEDPNFRQSGVASWYGDAFHGRLTANGEIYDMNMLSAAHPTMPLPSYARVTNKKNGNSVIVRVNDRGPYAHGRAIDLSRKAAELLDYTHSGTAQVAIEYVGRAPVNGNDDAYLLASYQPGDGGQTIPGQGDVMVAMNGAPLDQITDTQPVLGLAGVEVSAPRVQRAAAIEPYDPFAEDGVVMPMPQGAPIPLNRPQECMLGELCAPTELRGQLNGYADARVSAASRAAPAFAALGLTTASIKAWKNGAQAERILIGSFSTKAVAGVKSKLSGLATISIETNSDGIFDVYASAMTGKKTDDLLKKVWKQGFRDAFVVR